MESFILYLHYMVPGFLGVTTPLFSVWLLGLRLSRDQG